MHLQFVWITLCDLLWCNGKDAGQLSISVVHFKRILKHWLCVDWLLRKRLLRHYDRTRLVVESRRHCIIVESLDYSHWLLVSVSWNCPDQVRKSLRTLMCLALYIGYLYCCSTVAFREVMGSSCLIRVKLIRSAWPQACFGRYSSIAHYWELSALALQNKDSPCWRETYGFMGFLDLIIQGIMNEYWVVVFKW